MRSEKCSVTDRESPDWGLTGEGLLHQEHFRKWLRHSEYTWSGLCSEWPPVEKHLNIKLMLSLWIFEWTTWNSAFKICSFEDTDLMFLRPPKVGSKMSWNFYVHSKLKVHWACTYSVTRTKATVTKKHQKFIFKHPGCSSYKNPGNHTRSYMIPGNHARSYMICMKSW